MLKSWILHVQYYLNNNHRSFNNSNTSYLVPIIILINKADIKTNRKFKISDVNKLADEFTMNILVYETSAKENSKLTYVFEKVAALVSGHMTLPNETTINTTAHDDENQDDENHNLRRKKSFQLKVGKERDKNKNGSCCNKSA
jgi:Fe2+ transport system protein B